MKISPKYIFLFVSLSLCLNGCGQKAENQNKAEENTPDTTGYSALFEKNEDIDLYEKAKYSKISEIPSPDGYKRVKYAKGSYSDFVRNLSVTKNKYVKSCYSEDIFWDGLGVIKLDMMFPKSDLEQCADWAMRLWGEYHKETRKLDSLYLLKYSGEKNYFRKAGKSYSSFMKYSFGYSNSHSIKKGCNVIEFKNLRPGDMLVQNQTGGIGHVCVILDACEKDGEKLYLLGYSFMPAQQMHIEKAPEEFGINGWFIDKYLTSYIESEFSSYGKVQFRRF